MNYDKLQNGSDIRGVALPGVAGEDVNLTAEVAFNLSKGFASRLAEKTGKEAAALKIAVGHDPRLSAGALRDALTRAFAALGATVYSCGLASTPAMFMSTIFEDLKCDGAVMITASHLPYNRNGFKYFDANGGFDREDVSVVIRYAETEAGRPGDAPREGPEGRIVPYDLISRYADYLKELIREGVNDPDDRERPLSRLHIVVDAGNGAGGFYAEKVLVPLGADVSGSQYGEPDGRFPNHAPNPEDGAAMASVKRAVSESKADLGIIFDTDVDRVAAIDRFGNEINRNGVIALASALIAKEHAGATIVTDSVTSDGLTEFLEKELGLKHCRFKRGYRNVIDKSMDLNAKGIDSPLAIETSGHAAFRENRFLDDGAYLAAKIVTAAARMEREGKSIDALISKLRAPKESKELRLAVLTDAFSAYADEVLAAFEAFARDRAEMTVTEPNYEGVRVAFRKGAGDGWCLLRKSLHDPLLPLNIESDSPGGVAEIIKRILPFFARYEHLDAKNLSEYGK
jgi:phosphomannomutase